MYRTLLLSAVVMVAVPSEVSACSCGGPRNALDAYGASAIFRGQVVCIELRSFGEDPRDDWTPVEVEFAVTRVWRGRVEERAVVLTSIGTGDCGLDVYIWGEYIVPVYDMGSGEVTSGLCAGVEPVYRASTTLAALGAGYAPSQATRRYYPEGVRQGMSGWARIVFAYSVLALAVLIFVCLRCGRERISGHRFWHTTDW